MLHQTFNNILDLDRSFKTYLKTGTECESKCKFKTLNYKILFIIDTVIYT